MSHDKVPTGKIARASKFLKTGAKVGRNYAKHYGKKIVGTADKGQLDAANARDLFAGFSELRGSALKVAQMLAMDSVNFSEQFTNVMQKAQYSVPPMSPPMAVQAFTKSMGKSPSEVFDEFNAKAVAAASMGQVHEAWKDGKKLAVKIQYPGVADSIKTDLKMMKGAVTRFARVPAKEIQPYFDEIEERLLEEADYVCELNNSVGFARDFAEFPNLIFPTYYPELSSDRVIVMDWLPGKHFKEFLADKPDRDLVDKIAQTIWAFYEYQIHVLKRVNADPHPGNFLLQPDGTVGVLDFGCTKVLEEDIHRDYFILARPDFFQDRQRAEKVLERLELLRPSDTGEKRDMLYDLIQRLITLISKPYHDGYFDFTDRDLIEKMTEVSVEMSELREVRGSRHYLFLNKTYFGLYSLFQMLEVKLDTVCQYHDFLTDAAKAAGKHSPVQDLPEAERDPIDRELA